MAERSPDDADYKIDQIAPGVFVHSSARDFTFECGCMKVYIPGEPHIPGMFEPLPDCPEHGDPVVLAQLANEEDA